MFSNLVALSESTPGPIMVNMATYVGSKQGGFLGALAATVGVVLPSFFILLAVTILFHNLLKHKKIQAVLKGVKPCLMGVILATGAYMAFSICVDRASLTVDPAACMILFSLGLASILWQAFRKRDFPPIAFLAMAAIMGCILY